MNPDITERAIEIGSVKSETMPVRKLTRLLDELLVLAGIDRYTKACQRRLLADATGHRLVAVYEKACSHQT
jgi:hypothetical protein